MMEPYNMENLIKYRIYYLSHIWIKWPIYFIIGKSCMQIFYNDDDDNIEFN